MKSKVATLIAGGTFLLLLGMFVGYSLNRNRFIDGKLSACNDLMNVMVQINPLMELAQPQCVVYKDDVAVKIYDDLFSLDGTKKLN